MAFLLVLLIWCCGAKIRKWSKGVYNFVVAQLNSTYSNFFFEIVYVENCCIWWKLTKSRMHVENSMHSLFLKCNLENFPVIITIFILYFFYVQFFRFFVKPKNSTILYLNGRDFIFFINYFLSLCICLMLVLVEIIFRKTLIFQFFGLGPWKCCFFELKCFDGKITLTN